MISGLNVQVRDITPTEIRLRAKERGMRPRARLLDPQIVSIVINNADWDSYIRSFDQDGSVARLG